MEEEQIRKYNDLPRARSQRLIDFDEIEIRTLESFPPQYVLVVEGTKPYMNMEVSLVPLVYIRQPEYWGLEVVGRLRGGIGLPAQAPFTVSLLLSGVMGTEGVEVIGATRSETLEVPERESDGVTGEPPGSPGPNLFRLRGKDDVEIGYGLLRARREFFDYKNKQHNLTFSREKGNQIRCRRGSSGCSR